MIMTKAFLYKLKGKTRNIKPVNLWIKTDFKKRAVQGSDMDLTLKGSYLHQQL